MNPADEARFRESIEAAWHEYVDGAMPPAPILEPQKVTLTVTFSPSVLTSEEIALLIREFLNDNQERWREGPSSDGSFFGPLTSSHRFASLRL